jgi:hypothetical protein
MNSYSHMMYKFVRGIRIVDKQKYTSSYEVTIQICSISRRYIQVRILSPNKDNTSSYKLCQHTNPYYEYVCGWQETYKLATFKLYRKHHTNSEKHTCFSYPLHSLQLSFGSAE